jgi:hypothetical protein
MHTAQLSLDAPPPTTRVSATSVFHRPKRAAPTALTALTPAMGRPSGTRDWHSGSGNCGNPYRRPAPAPPGIPHQATAERWVRWWAGIAISATSGVFTALFGSKWRRGWDSNPRYACTHNGFRDRPDRPLWHLSGAPLIGGRFCPGNSAVGGADIPLFSLESGVSGVDLGGFLRIFRPPPAGHSGPPCSFVLSGIRGRGPANSLGMVGSAQPEGF